MFEIYLVRVKCACIALREFCQHRETLHCNMNSVSLCRLQFREKIFRLKRRKYKNQTDRRDWHKCKMQAVLGWYFIFEIQEVILLHEYFPFTIVLSDIFPPLFESCQNYLKTLSCYWQLAFNMSTFSREMKVSC